MSKSAEVIIVTETALQGWMRDAGSAVMFIALIGIGVFLESNAMQWVGAIIGFIVIISRAMRIAKDNRYTIAKARARLDEIERQSAA